MLAQHLLIEELLLELTLLLSKGLEKRVQLLLGRLVCMKWHLGKFFFSFLSFLKKFFFKKKKFYSVTGNNPSVGTARNPYNINYYPGGSSSGSAAAVASGLCPIAIGSDTGGSIRIPSAICGIYGLKTTWGRFSAKGECTI